MSGLLFARGGMLDPLNPGLREVRLGEARDAVCRLRLEELGSEEEICSLVLRYASVPIALHEEQMNTDLGESPGVDGSGRRTRVMRVTVTIPFSGDAELFRYSPSTSSMNPPAGQVGPGGVGIDELSFYNDFPIGTSTDLIRDWRAKCLGLFRQWIGWANADAENLAREVEATIKAQASQRRQELEHLEVKKRRELNS